MVLIVDQEHDPTLESDEMEWLAPGSPTALPWKHAINAVSAIFMEGKVSGAHRSTKSGRVPTHPSG